MPTVAELVPPLDIESTLTTDLREIAEQSSLVLDYHQLLATLNASEPVLADRANKQEQISQALETLRQLEMAPFTSESVAQYKELQLRQRRQPSRWRSFRYRLVPPIVRNMFEIFSVLGGMFLIATVASIALVVYGQNSWLLVSVPLAAIGLGGALWMLCRDKPENILNVISPRFERHEWQTIPLSGYGGQIPVDVLRRAIAVKQAIPDGSLRLDELRTVSMGYEIKEDDIVSLDGEIIVHDPFLILEIAGIDLYIDVWDEPGFTARREYT